MSQETELKVLRHAVLRLASIVGSLALRAGRVHDHEVCCGIENELREETWEEPEPDRREGL